jgi:hypothetical protein
MNCSSSQESIFGLPLSIASTLTDQPSFLTTANPRQTIQDIIAEALELVDSDDEDEDEVLTAFTRHYKYGPKQWIHDKGDCRHKHSTV